MKLEQRPSLTQIQKLSLTPEIKQSLTILQLPMAELQIYLSQQIEENCFLEFDKDPVFENDGQLFDNSPPAMENRETSLSNDPEELLWEDYYQGRDSSISTPTENIDPCIAVSDGFAENENIRDYLFLQLHLTSSSLEEQRIGEYLIENINDDGYLCCEVDEAARILHIDPSRVNYIIQLIQTFDPPGIGSGSISECLAIQLKAQKSSWDNPDTDGLYDLSQYIIENYLSEVAEGQISRIARNMHRPVAIVSKAVEIIKKLDPKPGRHFGNNTKTGYIFPDVIIKKVDHQFVIEIMETSSEKLRINDFYYHLLISRNNTEPETLKFLKERYNAALWLIKCLEQRRLTIHKITAAIVQTQQEFLEKGINFLRPLTLQKISEIVGLDESTVSRAISGKYIQTPHGVFGFKYFFSSGINTLQGDAISSQSIKKIIRELIRNENPARPLSDQNLLDTLRDKGIMISRRTITKYREELMIPDSRKRRC